MAKQVEIIVAATRRGEIGFKGTIPWKLEGDLKRFKELTMGNVVVMGRKTVASLPGPLLGRKLIVVSENLANRIELDAMTQEDEDFFDKYQVDDVVSNLRDAVMLGQCEEFYPDAPSIFIAGGVEIYKEAMGFADIMHLSLVIPTEAFAYDAAIPYFAELVSENFNVTTGWKAANVLVALIKPNYTYHIYEKMYRRK